MKDLFCEQRNLEMSMNTLRQLNKEYKRSNKFSNIIAKLEYNNLWIIILDRLYSNNAISFKEYISLLSEILNRVIKYSNELE